MKQNAQLFRTLARVHRTALDLRDPPALQEDLVLKVREVKEVSVGQLVPPVLVEIQVLLGPRVLQALRDPMACLFPVNKVARE